MPCHGVGGLLPMADFFHSKQVRALREDATQHLPKGKLLSRESLFA